MKRHELEKEAIDLYGELDTMQRRELFVQMVMAMPTELLELIRNSALLENINGGRE